MASTLTIPLPSDFDLARAVCSYGYFILAPNRWDPKTRTLTRPLRGQRDRVIRTRIAQRGRRLELRCDKVVATKERKTIKQQVTRMLRIDEDLTAWWRLSRKAKREGFGRLFRSPTLFEDVVKTITTCNVTWPNTRRMNALLCKEFGKDGFPTPRRLAGVDPDELKVRCKVGYRAERIVRLAKNIGSGALDLDALERPDVSSEEAYTALLQIHGLGPYAAANLCQLLGHYDRLAIDSETYRHYCQLHKIKRPDNPKHLHDEIEAHYAGFSPYAFLAYWHELWGHYEQHADRPSDAWDDEVADSFTANAM